MNELNCVCVYGVRQKRIIVDSGSIYTMPSSETRALRWRVLFLDNY